MITPTTPQLISKAVDGDHEAFEQILTSHNHMIILIISGITTCPYDAEDIKQEVALRVYQNIASLHRPEAFCSWLRTIVNRECYRFIRKRKKDFLCVSVEEFEKPDECFGFFIEMDIDCNPFAHIQKLEFVHEIGSAIECLTEPCRKLFDMRYNYNLKCADIAALTGMKAQTVSMTLFRAKERLRKLLSGRCISYA